MKKLQYLLVFLIFMTVSCSPATTPSVPTATFTPLEEIDLKNQILIPSSDMPEGFLATKTQDSIPNLEVPEPLKLIWQQIETESAIAGGVRIYLYESKLDAKEAYSKEVAMQKKLSNNVREISAVGEIATLSDYVIDKTVTDLTFFRCFATVTIRMLDISSEEIIIEYAGKIDSNIQKNICH